ncbi:MAG: hypothetical protein Q8K60_05470, partial [Parachlamydiaceae bacterium]|nr:hypothetical protein [Parachlamydiaceae bacterium]
MMDPEDIELDQYSEPKCLSFRSPRIFNGIWKGKYLDGFDAVTITLDGELNSPLEWEKEKQLAKEIIESGHAIFWKLNLGLEKKLSFPF